jgi:predicted alpha/beta-hydrolase family hydrolase
MDSAFMTSVAEGLTQHAACRVVRFEFPYMARLRASGRRSAPDRMPLLEASFEEVARAQGELQNVVLAGKSMGGRVATRIADRLGVRGIIAFGYPFHPPKKSEQLRTAHLAALMTPCLIVQGMRDPFGTKLEVDGYALSPRIQTTWVEDGDHSFVPRKKSGRTEEQNIAHVIAAAGAFLATLSRVTATRPGTSP